MNELGLSLHDVLFLCFLMPKKKKKQFKWMCAHIEVYMHTHNGYFKQNSCYSESLISSNYYSGVAQSKPRNVDINLTCKLKFISCKIRIKNLNLTWDTVGWLGETKKNINCSNKWLWTVPGYPVPQFTQNQQNGTGELWRLKAGGCSRNRKGLFFFPVWVQMLSFVEKGSW